MSDEDRPQDTPNPWSAPPPGQEPTTPLPYGQEPYGQQPYGPPPGEQPAYGQPGYPPPPGYAPAYGPGYAPGYGPNPQSAAARSSATLWLILNIVSVLFCSNLPGIVGAIYAGLALGRADLDPVDAQRKTRLAKIWFFAGLIVVAVLLVVVVIGFLLLGRSGNTYGTAPSVATPL